MKFKNEARQFGKILFDRYATSLLVGGAFMGMIFGPTGTGPKFASKKVENSIMDCLKELIVDANCEHTKTEFPKVNGEHSSLSLYSMRLFSPKGTWAYTHQYNPSQVGKAWVYVFDPEDGQCGHSAIGFINPHTHQFEYVSLWPGIPVSTPPQWVIPTKGVLSSGLANDIKAEGKDPDHVIEISGLDVGSMSELVDELRKLSDEDRLMYQFFNKADWLSMLSAGAGDQTSRDVIFENPFDGLSCTPELPEYKGQAVVQNCTSLLYDILDAGGFKKNHFDGMPWTHSPLMVPYDLSTRGGDSVKVLKDHHAERVMLWAGKKNAIDASLSKSGAIQQCQ